MSKAAQRKEKQQWTIQKPKVDNAGKLSGIYFMDPEDTEFKETMKTRGATVGIAYKSSQSCAQV